VPNNNQDNIFKNILKIKINTKMHDGKILNKDRLSRKALYFWPTLSGLISKQSNYASFTDK
jgi:hypothetical protein